MKSCRENEPLPQTRNEEELARTKARLENTLNSITEGYYALDREWRFLAANYKAEEHFGRSASELRGLNLWKLTGAPPDSLAYKKFHEAAAQGEPVHFEAPSHIRPGFWAELHVYPRDGMLEVYFADISSRKQAEEALRESEKKYHDLVQNAPAAIYEIDYRQRRFTQVNDAMCIMLGYSREELLALDPNTILDAAGRVALQERIAKWLAGEPPDENIEYRVTTKAGHARWMLLKAKYTLDEHGQPLGAMVIAHDITERRKMEAALRWNNRRHALLWETASSLLQSEDPQSLVEDLCRRVMEFLDCHVFFNYLADPASERLQLNAWAGIAAEEAARITWLDYGTAVCGCAARDRCRIVAENIPDTADPRTALVKTYGIQAYCCHPLLAGGHTLGTLSFGTRSRRQFAPEEVEVMATVSDLVAAAMHRIQSSRALQEGREDLNRAQAVGNIGSWRLDFRENQLAWSDENHRIFGIPKGATLSYETFLSTIHPEDRDYVDARWKASLAGEPYDIEHRIEVAGELKWVREKAFLERTSDGRLRSAFGISQDITARKQAEEALRWRAEELERLLETVPVAVWVAHDPQCLTITGNRRANEFYEAQVGENVSASALPETRRFFTPAGRELAPEELPMQKASAANQDVRDEELHVLLPSGRRIAMLGSAVPLRDQAGRVRGCIGAFLNITERKRAEEELREADRRKDEFLAMLAHELRNPLAPMRNAVHLLKRATDPDKLQRQRELLDRQVTHMARLLDDLLDVSRITRGRITLQKQRLPLPELLRHAVEVSAPLIHARRLTMTQTYLPETLWVEGDRDRLAQVFGNLLGNAVKYTPENGRIWLELGREAGQAVVRVRDNGQGIAPELLPRLFDLFVQGTPSSGSQGGLGIGLTLVKMLVEMHRGSVSAASSGPGQGSEFCVRLPLSEAGLDRAQPPAWAEETRLALRVLVVDDVADSAESLSEALAAWGCQTLTAMDGEAALSAVRSFIPDVVLLDIGMPGMDGYQVARRLRGEEYGKQMMLVALTGYGQDQDRQKSREAGFDAHFVKPVDFEQLYRLLTAAMAASTPPQGSFR